MTEKTALFSLLDIMEVPGESDLARHVYDEVISFAQSIGYRR